MSQSGQFLTGIMIVSLTGDAGGAITPVAGNIDILGGAGITVTGTPGTLTIAHGGVFADSFPTDAGTAVPVAGDTNILGGANINTTGAGNTVTVILNDTVTLAGALTATALTASTGNIVTTLGDIISNGAVSAVTSVTAGNGIVATTGDITANTGDIVSTLGAGDFASTVTAGTGITATTGNITASTGNFVATAGDLVSSIGDIFAGNDLEVVNDVTFQAHTDGGLIVDGSGLVSASAAVTHSTGFATWTGAGAYFDDTVLGSFEVLRGGTGYINSVPITWAGSQTVTGMTAGNTYLIYMDDTGTIGKTTSFTQATFDDYIVLFQCLRDSTGTNIQYTVKENHPYRFCSCVSFYCHEVIGTVIENNDNGANITLNGTQKIEIVGTDELADHGLYTEIPDGGGTPETWNNMLTNVGGKWITYRSNDTFNGYWNSGGTATAPTGTKFSVYTLYVSKDTITSALPTYWAVLDDQEYNNLAGAQLGIANGTMAIATAELAALEFAQLGHIIYKQSTDTIVDVIIEKSTLRGTVSGGAGTNDAALVLTNVTNFDGLLSASDTTVQVALETIDEWGKTTTDHAVLIGNGTGSAIGSLAVGATGEMIIGNTGADPTWSATGALTTLNATTVNATTFDTNVVAAGVTLAGTSLLADGTDANIDINITAKGTGHVIIDDLTLTNDLIVANGGTGASTHTDHGVLVGAAVAAITSLAVGTNGQLLVGSTGADPVFATVASADGSIAITGGAGTIDLSSTGTIGVNNQTGITYELVLADRGKIVTCTNAAAIDVTIPVNADVALAIGTNVLISQNGAGIVTLVPEGGVTLRSRGALLDTAGQYAVVSVTKIAINEWLCGGDLA